MPRLDRAAQLEADPGHVDLAETREAELEERLEPALVEGGLALAGEVDVELVDDIAQVGRRVGGQQVAVVQAGTPPDQVALVRLVPESGDQRTYEQRLHKRHPGVRRHLEAAHLEQAEPARAAVRAVQLVDAELGSVRVAGHVDEQVPQQPVGEPGLGTALALAPLVGILAPAPVGGDDCRDIVVDGRIADHAGELDERGLELVQRLVPALVDPRSLAGGPDEAAGEHVREGRVVLPVRDERAEQVGPAQQR